METSREGWGIVGKKRNRERQTSSQACLNTTQATNTQRVAAETRHLGHFGPAGQGNHVVSELGGCALLSDKPNSSAWPSTISFVTFAVNSLARTSSAGLATSSEDRKNMASAICTSPHKHTKTIKGGARKLTQLWIGVDEIGERGLNS